ncbi:MAG: cell division protein FtsA [Candidatus Nomurabacteria bacterium]|nr:cell division protein FtsA [Candidatus Nomurabacteria bacterium]USN87654.1 MAG: cell division protein FtsA [Candidatus Nomurabacteria bacterium]
MAEQIITGIDVGTYHIKVAIARLPKHTKSNPIPEIIGTGYAESRGLKSGYIMQPDDVSRSIKSAISQAEKMAGVIVKKAHVAIGSIGLEEVYSRGEIIPARADSEITSTDLDKVMQDSEDRISDHIPNRKILHNIPLRYTVDGTEVLGRPQGMRGTKLEVDTLFITTYEQHVNDLISAIESIGVYVEDVIASPLATSFVLLSKTQKRAGCILVNIGSETTSLVVFEDSTPISLKIFPVGSTDITNDIALGLKVPIEEAEKIKRGNLTNATFSKKRLDEIIQSRLQNIFALIDNHLKKIKRDGLLPAGVILTGGGSSTSGIVDVAKNSLSLPARTATLEIGKHTKVKDASWAVTYGLCMWGASDTPDNSTVGIVKQTKKSLFAWLNQFLP